jgi:3'-phosphoadenosine 5'-phosphosulfate sulfotransferase (PAPS reductase)/FAD synthetase
MPRKTRAMFGMWAKQKEYKRKVNQSKQMLTDLIHNHKCIVLYSGGKDSLVLLHMALIIEPNIPVYHFSAGYDYDSKQIKQPKEVTKELTKIALELGVDPNKLFVRGQRDPSSKRFFGNLFKIMKERNINIEILGIRAEESITRRERVSNQLIQKEGQRFVSFPLKWWTWRDIWAYIVTNNLPYFSLYDKYGPLQGYDKVRWSMLFSKFALDKGGSYYLDGVMFPELRNERPEDWNR